MNEYEKISGREAVVGSAQRTINVLCDYMRSIIGESVEEFIGDTSAM